MGNFGRTGIDAGWPALLFSNADLRPRKGNCDMTTANTNRLRGAIVAASLAGVAALALAAPAFADEYSSSQTTTTYQAAPPPPPPVAQTTTTTTTTDEGGYVAEAPPPPPPPPAPAPGVTVGIPGVVGVHVGP